MKICKNIKIGILWYYFYLKKINIDRNYNFYWKQIIKEETWNSKKIYLFILSNDKLKSFNFTCKRFWKISHSFNTNKYQFKYLFLDYNSNYKYIFQAKHIQNNCNKSQLIYTSLIIRYKIG